MKHLSFGLAAFMILTLMADGASAQRRRGRFPGRTGWLQSYGAAREQARKTGKPMMVVIRCVP